MCSKEQLDVLWGKISVGVPSWSESVEGARARLGALRAWLGAQAASAERRAPDKKMPHALRGRAAGWGLCPCLQKDEPPEITYCVVGGGGVLAAVTPTAPMPPQDELDAKFAELVEELDLTAVNKAAMLQLPAAKKWQIYCSRRPPEQAAPAAPEHYVRALNEIAQALTSSTQPSGDSVQLAQGLKTALRTSAHSFVLRFAALGGLPALLAAVRASDGDLHLALITGIKALMNNSTGRAHVLAHPTSIDIIAQSLSTENIKTKIAALEILGAVCLVPGGHKKVLEGMIHYQKYAYERARFQSIVNDLDRSSGQYKDEVSLKTAIMSFINAVLNYGPGVESLEFRLHLRYEFLMLGIQPVIEKLRKHENETLDRHIDFFELVRTEDERELARRFDSQHVDAKSATAMFDLIRRKLSHTAAYPHLLSLLQHCLLMPLEYGPHTHHWLLLDRIVQQIVLQHGPQQNPSTSSQENVNTETSSLDQKSESGTGSVNKLYDPDVAPLEINVGEIVQLLAKEEELIAARTKADMLERENVDMASELAKKERQIDEQTQEREELESSAQRMKERLEKETAAHMESSERARAALYRSHQLEQQLTQERGERLRFEKLVSEGSIPDDAKVSNLKSAVIEMSPPPPPPPLMPLAPPPPPAPAPPLAPPPLMQQPLAAVPPRRKNAPQPGNPLKSFNWSKLPDSKLHGTIWTELDDTKLYETMDLETIDRLFCAYQKNGVQNEGSVEDLRQMGTKPRTKILTVIDGRRAQNCTILLSKLKMTDEEICRAILKMDSGEQLPIDMVEQLLKFTPSPEEAALLEEHQDELDNMARADRFLYEISKLPHYSQRVRALLYKKRFAAASGEAGARVAAVLRAARDTQRSRRLRTLLEIVLAIGNYMNRGARGNASGFRLSSLNKLADTKSSMSRNTTLLHYLVEVLEKKFKDVLVLEEDLPHVRLAAKVCMEQLEKDVVSLRAGLGEVQRELDYHAGLHTPAPGDAFLPVMREFHAQASCRISELEDQFQDMKSRLDSCLRMFGEESGSTSPEQLFGALDAFLTQLGEVRAECTAARRKRDEEARRLRHEQELKKRTMERKQASSLLNSVSKSLGLSKCNGNAKTPDANGHPPSDTTRDASLTNGQAKGEFDDLISALRTGDVFGDDIAKFKRARKTSKASQRGRDSPPRAVCREDSRERT